MSDTLYRGTVETEMSIILFPEAGFFSVRSLVGGIEATLSGVELGLGFVVVRVTFSEPETPNTSIMCYSYLVLHLRL